MSLLSRVAGAVLTSLNLVPRPRNGSINTMFRLLILSSWLEDFKQRFLLGEGAGRGTIRSRRVNRKGPRVTPALCDAAKQYTRSRQRAQASGAANVMAPAGYGGDGGGRE